MVADCHFFHSCLSQIVKYCQRFLSQIVKGCHSFLPKIVKSCQQLSESVGDACHRLSESVTCHGCFSHIVRECHLSQILVIDCQRVSPVLDACHRVSESVTCHSCLSQIVRECHLSQLLVIDCQGCHLWAARWHLTWVISTAVRKASTDGSFTNRWKTDFLPPGCTLSFKRKEMVWEFDFAKLL